MKKAKEKKLSLEKFNISKLKNTNKITGGNLTTGETGGPGEKVGIKSRTCD